VERSEAGLEGLVGLEEGGLEDLVGLEARGLGLRAFGVKVGRERAKDVGGRS